MMVIATFSLIMVSCGNKSKKSTSEASTEEVVDKSGKEYTSAYICPMHCKGSGSDKAGTCPVCEMDYVVNKDHGHNHDHDGNDHGHDHGHGDHEGHNH